MKKLLSVAAIFTLALTSFTASAQAKPGEDKSKRPSPPAKVSATLASGAVVTIDYSQPSVKGRAIGKDLEPLPGKVWRTGANEATVFEVSKDVKVEGKTLAAGKYALFSIDNGKEWTLIFNKVWDTWGAYDYEKNKAQDALLVKVKKGKSDKFAERFAFTADNAGTVSLFWGDIKVDFKVK